jgi:hypothetical protein
MANLFEISQELFLIQTSIEDNGGEIPDFLLEQLEIAEENRDKKLQDYTFVVKSLKSQSELLREEAHRLLKKAQQYDKSVEVLKDRMLQNVIAFGPVKTALVKIATTRSKAVEISDDSLIPDMYCRFKREPSKTDIKNAILDGQDIPGASIVENISLRIS